MSFPAPTKKQAQTMWYALTSLAVAIVLALAALSLWGLGWLLHKLSAVVLPLALALILAYILHPVVEYFERKGLKRFWAVCVVFALGAIFSITVIGSVLPGLKDEMSKLIGELPSNVEALHAKAQRFAEDSSLAQQLPASWRRALVGLPEGHQTNAVPAPVANTVVNTNGTVVNVNLTVPVPNMEAGSTNDTANVFSPTQLKSELDQPLSVTILPAVSHGMLWAAKWLMNKLTRVTTWVEFLIGFILVPIYLFYFLLETESIAKRWTDYVPIKESPAKREVVFVLGAINECMIVFFRGQVLVAICVGILLTAGYSVLGLNYAVLLGLVAGVLGIIPYLGTVTSLALALSVAAFQFGDWTHPLIVAGIAATVKLLEDFLISPKIIGDRAGLHPLTIIVAVMVGMTLMGGFLGALLAIPLTAALRTLMFRYIWNQPEEKDEDGTSHFHKE